MSNLRKRVDMKTSFYNGNINLKRANVIANTTTHELIELKRCKEDIQYFVENYLKVIHIDKGLVPLELYPYQKKLVDHFNDNRFSIVLSCRQSGKTTCTVAYLLHYALFNSHKQIGVLANKGALAVEILDRFKLAYENLPFFLQQGVVAWNKKDIELENGSKIITGATGGAAARGRAFSLLFLDEAAFVSSSIWNPFWASIYPTISSGLESKVIMVSTPNGLNHYYSMWESANSKDPDKKSSFSSFLVDWRDVPRGGKLDKKTLDDFKKRTISDIGQDKWDVEYGCEFSGSQNTLISGYYIKNIVDKDAVFEYENLRLFELPEDNRTYVISVDVSRGKGLDKSAFSIIDVTEYPFKQVGTYYDNNISPLLFPTLIKKIATDYNNAYVLIENNDVGGQVVSTLSYELDYENIVSPQPKNSNTWEDGLKTTKYTKMVGCSTFRDLVENEKLILQCKNTKNELSGFIVTGGNSSQKKYAADSGYNDDLVMTLVNFSYLTNCPEFEEIQSDDVTNALFQKRMNSIEEELAPLPIISDGLDYDSNHMENVDGFGLCTTNVY